MRLPPCIISSFIISSFIISSFKQFFATIHVVKIQYFESVCIVFLPGFVFAAEMQNGSVLHNAVKVEFSAA